MLGKYVRYINKDVALPFYKQNCDDIFVFKLYDVHVTTYTFLTHFFNFYRLKLFLKLQPIKLRLYALVTLEVDLLFTTYKKVLYKATLWHYDGPTIQTKLIDSPKTEEDKSPPKLQSFGVSLNNLY